jgi:hypothetical protein
MLANSCWAPEDVQVRFRRGSEPTKRARLRSPVSRRNKTRRQLDRETAFVAALNAYQHGGDQRALVEAAGAVVGSGRPIALEHADTISVLTDELNIKIETYGDAAHAINRWLVFTRRRGPRH